MRTIFDLCKPRDDILAGDVGKADFAADLAQVVRNVGPDEYRLPGRFFAHTYPTRGLKNLLAHVCARLSGAGTEVAAIFRLGTSFGGGKTHALIALVHAAGGMRGVANAMEFIDPVLLPKGRVRIAAFDGENADPANGRAMDRDILAFAPWGEIAYALAGRPGYERVRRSDERAVAPGAETLRELFGGEPTLILLDELSVYLRKVRNLPHARDQLTAFLSSLFKAVEAAPNAALVYTLAIGKDGRATDAYSEESQFIADRMAELESASARKATLLNPTEDDETPQVLRRRLFERIDDAGAAEAIEAYRALWHSHREAMAPAAVRPETVESFRASYPLHPEVLATLTGKTATLTNFQRVRGMLRLLAATVARLWKVRPVDATAIHLHHIDPGFEPIYEEITIRLGQSSYAPAIRNDVAAEAGRQSLAEEIDEAHYKGLSPVGSSVARTILMHSLAFNEQLKGLSPEELRFSILGPATELSFIDDARQRFVADSAYLDDRPGAPLRFLAEANLTQIIRRQEQHIDPGTTRSELRDRIRTIFGGGHTFDAIPPFASGPWDVPDEVGDGRPKLAVMSYEGVALSGTVESIPELIGRIFERKGSDGSGLRGLRNHLVFVVAEDTRIDEMRHRMIRRLALAEIKKPERLAELAEHQQQKVLELEGGSERDVAAVIQQCYRHIFYPSRHRIGSSDVDLAHTAVDVPSAADRPGSGQLQVERTLRELGKLRIREDEPDSPAFIRDRTPLKRGEITTLALREEFRKDPGLPILIGDDIFIRAIRRGIESGEYVYRRGDLLYGPGDPGAEIKIDEQSVVFTMLYAKEKGIWPRQPAPIPPDPTPPYERPGTGATPPPRVAESPPPTPTWVPTFSAEGVLKEALIQLWEQARTAKIDTIELLSIRMFEATDAFRLLGAIGAAPGASKVVKLNGGYVTNDGSEMQLDFRGSPQDAQPVREFVEAQIRAAREKTIQAAFELTFADGLAMNGDAAEKLTERLTRFATGAAYVSATAEAKP